MMDILLPALWLIFVIGSLLVCLVILLQEGKGGGFGDALGTAGQQAFGVKASGVQKFTMWVAAVFLGSAIFIHLLNKGAGEFEVSAAPTPIALDLDGLELGLR